MKKLFTPYRLMPDVVREVVEAGRVGSYVLGDDEDGFMGKYAGRSDSCLQSRLATHNHLFDYDYFIFRYARDVEEAFRQECETYHVLKMQRPVLGNVIHPAAPALSGLKCPYCGFSADIAALFE
jgi:hypothetical protein